MATKTDTSMTIRMNSNVKRRAQELFSDLGLDMTTAINIFLRQAIYCNGFPFDVRFKEPNNETLQALKEVEEMKKNPNFGKSYEDVDAMMQDLLS